MVPRASNAVASAHPRALEPPDVNRQPALTHTSRLKQTTSCRRRRCCCCTTCPDKIRTTDCTPAQAFASRRRALAAAVGRPTRHAATTTDLTAPCLLPVRRPIRAQLASVADYLLLYSVFPLVLPWLLLLRAPISSLSHALSPPSLCAMSQPPANPAQAPNAGHKVRRPRAARACNLCRLKKNKCDELYPCTYCRSSSHLLRPLPPPPVYPHRQQTALTDLHHRSQCRVCVSRPRCDQGKVHSRVRLFVPMTACLPACLPHRDHF